MYLCSSPLTLIARSFNCVALVLPLSPSDEKFDLITLKSQCNSYIHETTCIERTDCFQINKKTIDTNSISLPVVRITPVYCITIWWNMNWKWCPISSLFGNGNNKTLKLLFRAIKLQILSIQKIFLVFCLFLFSLFSFFATLFNVFSCRPLIEKKNSIWNSD